jgi:hypothetical protein
MKLIYLMTIGFLLSNSGYGQTLTPKIEIYLLNHFVQPDKGTKRFTATDSDLQEKPLIEDCQIIGYDTIKFEYTIDTLVCSRLSTLNPSLPIGIQFVITVDRKPVISGYFWNPVSSFGCDWYNIPVICKQEIKIDKGLPEYSYTDIPEMRNDSRLVDALIKSNRLVNLDKRISSKISTKLSNDYLINGIMINKIESIVLDSTMIKKIEFLKDKKNEKIYGNQNGTIVISIYKEIFSKLRVKDFIKFNILNDESIHLYFNNKTISKNDLLNRRVSEFRKIDFQLTDNKILFLRK